MGESEFMNKIEKRKTYGIIGCNIILTAFIYIILCIISNVYPFGTKSNMIWDLNIQYVDYFAYFKQVLLGNAHIGYSFLKSLGGNAVGIFGYYLASPLNLLVVFFKTENLQMFVFVITLIKLVLIAVTFSIYLKIRFKELDVQYLIIGTMSFVLSQYVIGQMTNIMWLDGVYLLPVMMLGVYKFVCENKKGMLFGTILVSILFNWYTGYMNCLFIPFYFLLEESLKEKEENKIQLKKIISKGIKFCFVEIGGVLASSALFLPVVYCLLQGKGQMEENIFQFVTNGKFLEIFSGFMLGHTANNTHIVLYCGEFIFLAVVLFFLNKNIKKYEKVYVALMLIFLIAGCFFKPLENIWNGFRFAASYFYRFSYIDTIMLIYTAAYGLTRKEKVEFNKVVKIIIGIVGIWLLEDSIQQSVDIKYLWLSIFIMVSYGIFWVWEIRSKIYKYLSFILVIVELILNGRYVMITTYTNEAENYSEYVSNEQKLIEKIKKDNSMWYRMDETTKRAGTANVNESMVYDYYGIAHYSSAYDVEVSQFLSDMGYNNNVDVTTFDEPILPIDSLLGLKYLLAEREFCGYEKQEKYGASNGKSVYKNEYALNIVIPVSENIIGKIDGENPFEKINDLYSKILGEHIEIFEPIDNIIDTYENGNVEISTMPNDVNGIVYAYVKTDITDITLRVDENTNCIYNGWLSRGVFNIGKSSESHKIKLEKVGEQLSGNIQYVSYCLRLDKFQEIAKELQEVSIRNENIKDGNVKLTYKSEESGNAMLSIPYEQGWSASINGKKVDIEKGADTFIVLPVEKGDNEIVLKYKVPWVGIGVIITLVTLSIFGMSCWLEWRKKSKTNMKFDKNNSI